LPFPEAEDSDFWCQTDGDQSTSGNGANWSKFVWKIKNLSDRPEQKGEFFKSKVFRVVGQSDTVTKWVLRFFPKGDESSEADHISVWLRNISAVNVKVKCNLSFVISGVKIDDPPKVFCIMPNHDSKWSLDVGLQDHADLLIECKISVIDIDNDVNKCNRMKMILDLKKAFKSKDSMVFDVTVKCGDASFECNKFMMTSRSPVFKSMFQSNMIESQTNTVNIEDLQPKVVDEMLQYIHTGVSLNIDKYPQELLAAADRYQLDQLKDNCEVTLIASLDVDNCVSLLILSDMYNALKLRRAAVKYATENMTSISNTCDWKKELARFPSLMTDMIDTLSDSLKKRSDELSSLTSRGDGQL